jgi:serine/threonine protein kinase
MYDLNKEEGAHYITMEYVRGEDLKRLIRKMGQLSAGQAIPLAKQICEGLGEAHRLGVVHRDLKPQNVMVDEEGNARIMDFGIARSIKAKGITGAGVMIGTPEYMSPEQVEGKGADQRSDIYSLGVMLYEMVTGRVPFEGDTPFTIGVKHKSEIPKNPKQLNAQIPEDLSRVILRCIEKNPEERYDSTRDLARELHSVMEGILRIGEKASTAAASSEDEYDLQPSKHLQKIKQASLKKELAKIIAYSPLSIKTDIIHVTFNRTDRIVNTINEIAKNIPWDSEEIFFFGQGGGVITLIFDREKEALFQNILPQAMKIREKSAVIRIQEPKAEGFTPGADVPGLYAYYINQLSKIEVSILDIISTGTQLTFVIAEEDLIRAYSALNESIKYVRKKFEKPKP